MRALTDGEVKEDERERKEIATREKRRIKQEIAEKEINTVMGPRQQGRLGGGAGRLLTRRRVRQVRRDREEGGLTRRRFRCMCRVPSPLPLRRVTRWVGRSCFL